MEHAAILNPDGNPATGRRQWPALAMPLLLLALLTAIRLAVAAVTPLAPDEAYYWIWSRALAAGYPDHPPMVALWIHLGTLLAGDNALGVRLLGPPSAALGSVLLADAAACLLPNRGAGVIAAALLNATLLFGVGAVVITPDTPLLFFWSACLWAMARLVRGGNPAWWLAAGMFAGLALASKYTALLLFAGIALWVLAAPAQHRWLRRPAPWAGLVLGGLVFLPVVWWNAQHGWASFLRQGARAADWHPARAAQFLGELIGGQLGLATPLVFVLCVAGTAEAARRAWRTRDPGWTLLVMLTLPGVLVFVQHAFGDRVQGNWPAVLYPSAAIAAAGLAAPIWRRLVMPAVLLGLGITGIVYLQASLALLPVPSRLDPIARQMRGWANLAEQVDAAARRQSAAFVVAQQYGLASELARDLPPGATVIAADPRWRLFALMPAHPAGMGLLVWPGAGAGPEPAHWPNARLVGAAGQGTPPAALFRLYRVDGLPPGVPAVILPRAHVNARND